MVHFLATLIALCTGLAHAQLDQDLFGKRDAQQRAEAQSAREVAIAALNQRMVAGFRRVTRPMAPIDSASAMCSDGWTNSDYVNRVGQLCEGDTCFSLYARDPGENNNILFTCHFNLTNGSQCFAQAYSSPHEGFGGECVDTALNSHHIDINTSGPSESTARRHRRK